VENAQDHDSLAARLVEDEIVAEALNRSRADADEFAKGAL
jgi:hypothetical protein